LLVIDTTKFSGTNLKNETWNLKQRNLFYYLKLSTFHHLSATVGQLENVYTTEVIVEIHNGAGCELIDFSNFLPDKIENFKGVLRKRDVFEFKIDERGGWVGEKTNHLNHIFSVASRSSVGLGRGCCGYQKDTGDYGKKPFQRNKLSFIIGNLQAFSHIS
jgi:hypothetical protein